MDIAKQCTLNFQVRKNLRKSRCKSKVGNENSPPPKNVGVKRNLFENLSEDKTPRNIENFENNAPTNQGSPKKLLKLSKQDSSLLTAAKQVFHTSLPSRLVGRHEEISNIALLLQEHLSQKKSVSIYISGAPGTGKTSSLMHVLKNMDFTFELVFVNCMTLNSSQSIYKFIAGELDVTNAASKDIEKCIQNYLVESKHMTVIVLDEIDHLDSKGQEVLYSLFEWPQIPNSKLILVGVANALDLTDRVLPRLQAYNYDPILMHFKPYSHQQIADILADRLKDLQNSNTIIRPSAIQLCARKIGACTGDIRKALQVCRRAIELAEKQVRSQRVLSTTSDNSPVKNSSVVTVELSHINAVLNDVYGSRMQMSSPLQSNKTVTLPLQQVILLCCLILMKKCVKSKDMSLGKSYEVYKKACKKRKISEVSESEFYSICQLVEVRGFIHLSRNKVLRMTKVILKIDEKEAEHILQDKNLLASILSDESVVSAK